MASRLTDIDNQLRAITERRFQSTVQNLMTAYKWKWFHAPDNRPVNGRIQGVKAGFPDLIAVRGQRVIVAELKTETGRVSEDQKEWLFLFDHAGITSYVWRPRDTEAIKLILR
ncbi:VRR-NUC domain-containing protein [Arthrobacter roseus]|uniref:VRR-NUC domain-containing protein n=1 Tax=Arthrobacter roseus TaxID=136274 RepID=UPI0019652326|nr:VRR-NUC domain-containing protein [Arthrobacter roseus]MBM7847485.1 hypothetical protein [Arthrobacter roseus]